MPHGADLIKFSVEEQTAYDHMALLHFNQSQRWQLGLVLVVGILRVMHEHAHA